MNWRRFAWLVILLLIVTVVWATVELKSRYEKISIAESEKSGDLDREITVLRKAISDQEGTLRDLENAALWLSGANPMPWLTQQADVSDVSIVSVEPLPVENLPGYDHFPIKITVSGNYHLLGGFINRLERSPNAMRIDSFRIRRKEHPPEDIVMDLSLSYFQKTGEETRQTARSTKNLIGDQTF